MRYSTFMLLLSVVATTGCSGWEGPRPTQVQEQVVLATRAAEVLQVTFRASASGYSISSMQRVNGAPTLGINLDRDVLIVASDANGNALSSVSVANPRLAHTAGSRNPDSRVLDEATFTVRFADPGAINALSLEVRDGPNGQYKKRFVVDHYDESQLK